jgi:hypothetical protein
MTVPKERGGMPMIAVKNDARRVFMKKGTCSQALCYIVNREFGHLKENEERATDPLAGGIMQRGHQCGMLWGASLAAGAESFRRGDSRDQAIGIAMATTQRLMESFIKRTKTASCREITGCDWKKPLSIAKHMLSGKFLMCFTLAKKWAPEAIQAATTGLALAPAAGADHQLRIGSGQDDGRQRRGDGHGGRVCRGHRFERQRLRRAGRGHMDEHARLVQRASRKKFSLFQ